MACLTSPEPGRSFPVRRAIVALAALAVASASFVPWAASARDDAPPEIAARKNPVTELSDRDVRYMARQFKGKCARCHGLDGSGGDAAARDQQQRKMYENA